ncbi:glycosyltransferase family 32 protein [Lacticaseibacillus zhaodongensis]|uniref:glycosyltransferase family 32 protein n=1 Tax=Lacticaseibacillus zhaodongensis TaxID=2668065 RepID=UPI0012D2CAAE|nr:glycosyltransferase [Lacticaseibacillus zhaodongensis]
MIPKTIHYVWIGGKKKPKDVEWCIQTWKKKLPGYNIVEWNESNINFNENSFLKEAYNQKKWAFVSDYVRMSAIYKYGGVYFDTDVVAVHNLDTLLTNEAFVGFETPQLPFSAVFGAVPHHKFVKANLDFYDSVNTDNVDFNDESLINTNIASSILIHQFACVPNNHEQILESGLHVYPDRILCKASGQSYTIHVMTGSWKGERRGRFEDFKRNIRLHLTTRSLAAIYDELKKLSKVLAK